MGGGAGPVGDKDLSSIIVSLFGWRFVISRFRISPTLPAKRKQRRLSIVGLSLLVISPILAAQEPNQPRYPRFDLTPLLGYRTGMSFPIQPHVQGTNPRMVFDAGPSYGFAFGVRIHEDEVIEFRWARQDSHTHLEDVGGITSSPQTVTLDQFHGDFTKEFFLAEWPSWARPYVMGSAGATHVAGSANTHFTRFSFGIGGGVKFFVGQHLGFRIQAEWLPVLLNPEGTAICGAGCVVHIGGALASQGEATIGPILRF